MNKCAILILNYNSGHYLVECIPSILKQKGVSFELYVIDNNSKYNDLQNVKHLYPQVNYIFFKKNYGFAGGYNKVFKKLINQYEYVVLLNPDTVTCEDWLDNLIRCADAYSDAGAVVSAIIGTNGKLADGAGGYIINVFTGSTSAYHLNEDPHSLPKNPYPVFYGSGCSLLLKTSVLKEVGFFDDDYFAYMEEVDLCWRILLRGYKVYCSPLSKVLHYGSGSFGFSPYASYLIERNLIITYVKNLATKNLWMMLCIVPSRILLSLLFSRSYHHRIAKVKGILEAVLYIVKHFKKRQTIRNIRLQNDSEVFSNNPTSVYSFVELFKMIRHK